MANASGLIGYDLKSTYKLLIELGCTNLPPVAHDVMVGAFVLDSLRRVQTLTELAESDIGYDGSPFEDLDRDELITRAPEFIAALKALHTQQAKVIKAVPEFPALLKDIEWPIIPVLARMEHRGIRLDTDYMAKFAEQINDSISDYEQQIYTHADQEFNIASPAQLAEVLFTKMELPTQGIKKGKTGYSTAASELDKLRGQHPIIDVITLYREVTKLKSTYVDTLPKQVDEQVTRAYHLCAHCGSDRSFEQLTTQTYRTFRPVPILAAISAPHLWPIRATS